MDKRAVVAITDGSEEVIIGLLEQALTNLPFTATLKSYCVSDHWALDQCLRELQVTYKKYVIIYIFKNKQLMGELEKHAAKHNLTAIDILNPLIQLLDQELGQELTNVEDKPSLYHRIDALDFATRFDDGKDPAGILLADMVIIGISRTSKTPLSMYLANQNFRVVNIPLVPESNLPEELFEISPSRIFGLTIQKEKLADVRQARLNSLGLPSSSEYASINRINEEMAYAEDVMKRLGCAIIDVTSHSIEETADVIINEFNKRKKERKNAR